MKEVTRCAGYLTGFLLCLFSLFISYPRTLHIFHCVGLCLTKYVAEKFAKRARWSVSSSPRTPAAFALSLRSGCLRAEALAGVETFVQCQTSLSSAKVASSGVGNPRGADASEIVRPSIGCIDVHRPTWHRGTLTSDDCYHDSLSGTHGILNLRSRRTKAVVRENEKNGRMKARIVLSPPRDCLPDEK